MVRSACNHLPVCGGCAFGPPVADGTAHAPLTSVQRDLFGQELPEEAPEPPEGAKTPIKSEKAVKRTETDLAHVLGYTIVKESPLKTWIFTIRG